MYIVHNRIDVAAGDAEGFEQAFTTSMNTTLAGVPGLARATLLKPTSEGQPWVSTMEFASKDDFLAWMRSDSFKAAHANVDAPGMQAPSGIESFDVVADV